MDEVDNIKNLEDDFLGGFEGGKILDEIELNRWAKTLKSKFGTTLEFVNEFEDIIKQITIE